MSKVIKKFEITVGIPAYNEEKDVEHVVRAIIGQTGNFKILEIIVATDGCTDRTEAIVKNLIREYKIIKLISRKKRIGKISAINKILSLSKTRYVLIANADNIPSKNSISELIKKIKDGVGLVGPKAICKTSKNPNFTEKMSLILWRWHHIVALENPKIVAFMLLDKLTVQRIPAYCSIDEPSIEAIVKDNGYNVAYAPKAKLFVKPPSLFSEYFARRRSIHYGYFKLKKIMPNYSPPTMNKKILLRLLISDFSDKPLAVCMAAAVEIVSRILGYSDYILGKNNAELWETAKSSKGLIGAR